MPRIEIPSRYRMPTHGQGEVDVDGHTVRECIEAVEAKYPGFGELIIDPRGELHRFVRLFVNGEELDRGALDSPLAASDRVQVLAAAAGG